MTSLNEWYEEAYTRADWRPVERLYSQILALLAGPDNMLSEPMLGQLAERLERVAASYPNKEDTFSQHCLSVFTFADRTEATAPSRTLSQQSKRLYQDKRFERLYRYAPLTPRRRPKPFEALIETNRRLRDLQQIEQAIGGGTSAILAGSSSYGRYFNVRGAANDTGGLGSDLDLFLVVADISSAATHLAKLESVPGLNVGELKTFCRRLTIASPYRKDTGLMVSHKLPMWTEVPDPILSGLPSGYILSVHLVDDATLSQVLIEDEPILIGQNRPYLCRVIPDFRQAKSATQYVQRSFDGSYRKVLSQFRSVRGGWIVNREICAVEDGKYFPGLLQNFVLPKFEVRWDITGCNLSIRLHAFRWKIIERLRHEKSERSFNHLRLSLAHTRSNDFAPHVVRKIDGG